MPSLMARMLDILDVTHSARVLEIGTGTGCNAALLCRKLGSDNVASVDIDPQLMDEASSRLAELGFSPTLSARDGAEGLPENAPYDRIIATCAVSSIPSSWIHQLSPGGMIVADVRAEFASAITVLTKQSNGALVGPLLPIAGNFMWLRDAVDSPLRTGMSHSAEFRFDGDSRDSSIHSTTFNDPDFRLFANFAVPDVSSISRLRSDHKNVIYIRSNDQSWAALSPSGENQTATVRQGGTRRIWDEIESAAQYWQDLGSPSRDRIGLTVDDRAHHSFWLDDPNGPSVHSTSARTT
jgi:protein-L-isoaspartate O-methyltransferase